MEQPSQADQYNHSSRQEFVDYYAAASVSPQTLDRFAVVRDKATRLWEEHNGRAAGRLSVVDIGCGAGTSSRLWAERGHDVCGLDVNAKLIGIARERAAAERQDIRFDVGSATALPYEAESFDICVLPELLEHVADWEPCLKEAVRVLRPGGVLYLSTTNTLCPVQQEFDLPLYSWYPGPLKRYCEKLAVTTKPQLASFATYPAVNWFTYFELARWFSAHGMKARDRFDMMDVDRMSGGVRTAVRLIRAFPPARVAAHVVTPYLVIFATKPVATKH
jgi:2-polyprenyl-6-hydroxyphenyl methylase/3-demethylubiquinone-9 3-methyltransferase